jgi:RNA polymerase sigma factor (sigma-70 family)
LLSDHQVDEFTAFVMNTEPKLRLALCANFGKELGTEATAEALAFAWEHWDRVTDADNPAGYLYGVGRNIARKRTVRRNPVFPDIPDDHAPWIEPALPEALAGLPERQRVAVMLVHCFEWTLSEVAEFMEVSKPTAQKHVDRAMAKLRRQIGAVDEH